MADCVFCSILAGAIPAQKVHEDARCVAILDINPVAPGHALVLPREHHESWLDLPGDLAADLARTAQAVARGILKAAGAPGFNLLMNNHRCSGQAIPHAHFHVIPRKPDDGVKYGWPTKPAVGDDLAKMADRIRLALKS